MQKKYEENRIMIKKIANTFSRKSGIEKEDLESVANLVFCECAKKFNPGKGEFSKYLSTALYFELNRYVQNTKKYEENFVFEDIYDILEPEKEQNTNSYLSKNIDKLSINENIILKDVNVNVMSEDAKEVFTLILSPEVKIGENKITKKNLREYLKSSGWNWSRIENCFKELTLALN